MDNPAFFERVDQLLRFCYPKAINPVDPLQFGDIVYWNAHESEYGAYRRGDRVE